MQKEHALKQAEYIRNQDFDDEDEEEEEDDEGQELVDTSMKPCDGGKEGQHHT